MKIEQRTEQLAILGTVVLVLSAAAITWLLILCAVAALVRTMS